MKRFALTLTTVAALAIFATISFSTTSANAYDSYYGYGGHGFVRSYGHHGYGHGGVVLRSPRHRVVRHHYVAPVYDGGHHGYRRAYPHGGGLRISTPHFGFRIGH